jgi:hypothetical protein
MKRLMLLAIAAAGCGQDVKPTTGGDRTTSSDWQPLEIGWTWTYDVEGGGTSRRTVKGRESVGRFDCRVIEETMGDAKARWWLRSDRDGLKLYRFAEGDARFDLDDPAVWFKFPAQRGSRWEYEQTHGTVELQCFAVYEADEVVRVPAGEFTCARVRTFAFCERTQVFEKSDWYAKGIGLVRQTITYYDGRSAALSLKAMGR